MTPGSGGALSDKWKYGMWILSPYHSAGVREHVHVSAWLLRAAGPAMASYRNTQAELFKANFSCKKRSAMFVPPSFFFALLFKHVKTSLSHNSMVILQYKSPKPERKQVTRRCTPQLPRQDGRDKKPSGAGCWRIPTLEPRMRKRARFRRAATSRPSFSPVEIVSQFSVA